MIVRGAAWVGAGVTGVATWGTTSGVGVGVGTCCAAAPAGIAATSASAPAIIPVIRSRFMLLFPSVIGGAGSRELSQDCAALQQDEGSACFTHPRRQPSPVDDAGAIDPMKALVVRSLSDDLSGLALADIPPPVCRPGQLLIRVRAAALNHPDLLMTRGTYQLKPPLPFVPGMEMAGEVVEADAGFAPGERVVAGTRLGAFAELVAVDATSARRIPDSMDDAHAAAVGAAYLTAYVALVRLAGLKPGEWVLVHGATGGVGLAAVDLAHAFGARVIATSRSAAKLAVVARDYPVAASLPASGFREAVKELTGGGPGAGAAIVFDPVGGDVFDESTRCIAFGGRLLVVGFTSGRIASVATNIPLIKGFSLIGVRAGEYGRQHPQRGREDADAVWSLAAAGRIRPRVHARYPLERWRDAFEAMARADLIGKLVIEL